MAPEKRRKSTLNDGETGIFDIETAQSELQQVSRKKSRRSNSVTEGSSSDEVLDDSPSHEELAQYASHQKSKVGTQNEAADNGIIETVTCSNFMCHGHLEISLGPLINFIIGHNGSGKSAILTALTICLGGKASSTNRGQSLKSFIKEGQESAMLSVKIKNMGGSAYQQDIYGDSIIVERHFSRSGNSSFKLKTSSGRLISTRKSDLEEICDYFALQIDNPMNVLTQDMARQFLNSSTPQDKYKFFMKGTQLEHLDGDYLIVENNLDIIDTELSKKQADCEVFQERAKEAQDLLALSDQQEGLRDKLDVYRSQAAWVQVKRVETELAEADERLRNGDVTIHSLEMNAEGLSESLAQTEQNVEHARRVHREVNSLLAPLMEQKANTEVEFDMSKAENVSLQTQERQIVDALRENTKQIDTAKKNIEEENRRLEDADGGKNAKRLQEIETRKKEAAEADSEHIKYGEELLELKKRKDQAQVDNDKAVFEIKQQKSEVEEARKKLDGLIRDRGQRRSAYPANLPQLLRAIEQDDGFREKPVGPLGMHIRLTRPAWSSVLEKSFGSSLDSFVVTSKEDQIRLSTLMQKNNCVSPILIGRSTPIDTREHEPDLEFETSLRVLEIENDLARNSLIIGQNIDQTILISEREEAVHRMNSSRLRNVKQCFSHNLKPGTGKRFAYGYGGGLSEGFIQEYKGIPRMKTDIEYQISSQQEVLDNTRSELFNAEQRQRQTRDLLVQSEQAIFKHAKILKEKRLALQQTQVLVEELTDAMERDAIEEGHLDYVKGQLTEAEGETPILEGSYEDLVNAKDTSMKALGAIRKRLKGVDRAIEEVKAKVQRAESKINERDTEREKQVREANAAAAAVGAAKAVKAQQIEEREEKLHTVKDFTAGALEVCDRVPVHEGENEQTIARKLEKLQEDLVNAERRTGNRADVARNAFNAVEALNRAKAEVEVAETLTQLLKTTLVNRKERWKWFQKLISARASTQFMYLLSERGFRGKLKASHQQKLLDLNVEPDETKTSGKGHNTHGLSGGEKSFSTICLLLSIWEAMGAPIRCLDEFDVFMDSVNREVSMQMMIQFARDSPGKQFILITPQQTSKTLHDQDVRIIKMHDPERGQQTLNFSAIAD